MGKQENKRDLEKSKTKHQGAAHRRRARAYRRIDCRSTRDREMYGVSGGSDAQHAAGFEVWLQRRRGEGDVANVHFVRGSLERKPQASVLAMPLVNDESVKADEGLVASENVTRNATPREKLRVKAIEVSRQRV